MKISVIIPTYKPQRYIWKCLDSVCKQSFDKQEFEIVLVLNGCNEPYNTAIIKYINKHPEIKWNYIQINQGGVSMARNIALDVAKGEYITFIDDDDYISVSYLEEMLEIASADTISLCYPLSFEDGTNKYSSFYITKDYNSSLVNKKCSWYLGRRYFNGPVYKLIHRDIIGERRFDVRFSHGEDSLFMFLISDRFKWISFASKEVIYYRRIRKGSAMTSKRSLFKQVSNEWRLFLVRSTIFFSHPQRYSHKYYLRSLFSSIAKIVR